MLVGLVATSLLFITNCVTTINSKQPELICRDPDVGGTRQNHDRRFLVLGAENSGGGGVGNLLVFYPAAFYFAAITGRDIIITDNSALGGICGVITCGFPFVSQLEEAFPHIVNPQTLTSAPSLRHGDFIKYMESNLEASQPVVKVGGFLSKSDWWVWFNTSVACVAKLTACDLGDVQCAERHAFQRLIRGPFKAAFTEKEEKRISGVPQSLKHALLTLPHAYSPRLDIAIHLRLQFHHFEKQTEAAHPEYRREVADWLNGTDRKQVFGHMQQRLQQTVASIPAIRNSSSITSNRKQQPVYIYIAADNEEVKDALVDELRILFAPSNINNQRTTNSLEVLVMKVDSSGGIAHVKDFNKFKSMTKDEGLLDLVFDWYALSLANTILAWRKGGTNMLSTFVHSAQKVSGTTERTDANSGRGIGTQGYQLVKDKRGNMHFDQFWSYPFMEDYIVKQRRKRSRNRR